MLPFPHKVAFVLFAVVTCSLAARGFYQVICRIRSGRKDTEARFDHWPRRVWHAILLTLAQQRTFRKRPVVSFFHGLVFYGFLFYLLVNLVDALEGFLPFSISSMDAAGAVYNLAADLLSFLVLVGMVALLLRRFLLPSRRDFRFNARTLISPQVPRRLIPRDSLIVAMFILFHVGSRALGSAAKLAVAGPDRFQPFATMLSHAVPPGDARALSIFAYWGALGSVLLFLGYFPFSKHIHLFMAPAKYLVARQARSGVLPPLQLDLEKEELEAGASKLEELAWPRLLDAYACIQCNRCQDVCPATATGKALSPSALEINKRMELNMLVRTQPGAASTAQSSRPLLDFVLSPEAAWACTTCGACVEVCPVEDEPMLDIIDIRRHSVLIAGDFPTQLQTAFRGMERTQNPWGIAREKRMDWAAGLNVKTTEENSEPDVLYWVGCAASYDPQSQKTARAFVQLLNHANINFAVLGKKECCTGDSARRAGNEMLYQELATSNIGALQQTKAKLIVASCPHCMNALGQEYPQLGGDFPVVHHTEYLDRLVREGKLKADAGSAAVTFHDPCYLGRHNGVYDAPRNLLRVLSNDVRELDRARENSFCCGAGGAQFWKEEEPGTERISTNRMREVHQTLGSEADKVLAVGCPFCKSMLESTPGREEGIAVKDIAELLLEAVQRGETAARVDEPTSRVAEERKIPETATLQDRVVAEEPSALSTDQGVSAAAAAPPQPAAAEQATPAKRPAWKPRRTSSQGEVELKKEDPGT